MDKMKMKNLKTFENLNKALKPLDESVAGSADAIVVYFDSDIKGEFGKTVKAEIDKCSLETVSIKGNILVVSEGEGPKGGLKKFKKILGLN